MATDSVVLPVIESVRESSLAARAQRRWVAIAALTLIGGVLRFWNLDDQSLWYDEVLTVLNSETSVYQLLTDPAVDPNIPPLYYLLIHFLLLLAPGEALLRLPSAVAGTLSIPIFYEIVRRWCGPRSALIAGGLFALSPFHVWYSQEARPYALLLFLTLVTLWFLQRLLDGPANRAVTAGFLISAALAFYVHTVALPLYGLLAGYVLLLAPQSDRPRWIRRGLVLVLLLAPAVYQMSLQPPTASANQHYQFQLAHLGYVLWGFGTGSSLGPTLPELGLEGLPSVIRNIAIVGPALAALLAFLALGAVHLWRVERRLFWILILFLLLPICFAVLGGILTVHAFNARYAMVAFPAYLALIGIGVASIRGAYGRSAAFGVLLLISIAALANYYDDPRYQREDTRAAVEYLNSRGGEGDLVVSSAAYMALAIRHYGLRRDLTLVPYPLVGKTVRAHLGAKYVVPERVAEELEAVIGTRPQVWVFLSRTFHSDPDGMIVKYLDSRLRRDAEFATAGIRVIRYSAPTRTGG